MKKLWWRIRLFALMNWYGCTPGKRYRLLYTWQWTGDDCWIEYFPDFTPMEALREDWSYAD